MEKVSPFLCLILAAIFLVNLKDLWKTESMIGLLCHVTWFHECKLSFFFFTVHGGNISYIFVEQVSMY